MPPTPWGTTEGGAARGILTRNRDGRGTVHMEILQCEDGPWGCALIRKCVCGPEGICWLIAFTKNH